MLYTTQDQVVSPDEMKIQFARLGSSKKQAIDLPGATDHILAGDIISPQGNEVVKKGILQFLFKL
jgi:hypothetical protein